MKKAACGLRGSGRKTGDGITVFRAEGIKGRLKHGRLPVQTACLLFRCKHVRHKVGLLPRAAGKAFALRVAFAFAADEGFAVPHIFNRAPTVAQAAAFLVA